MKRGPTPWRYDDVTQCQPDADEPYILREGLRVHRRGVHHHEDEYDSRGFALLARMQRRHFWYRGRHRFLLEAVRRHIGRLPSAGRTPARAVDLGGGCGGWLDYLGRGRAAARFDELALADSSELALRMSREQLPDAIPRYQIDLLHLDWEARWEVAFLLDVLEHIPDHEEALRQIARALSPGGLLFVTVPALQRFWSWNDEVVQHQRRYSRADFARLAPGCGLVLLDARYFMFLLSPMLAASRMLVRPRSLVGLSAEERWRLVERTHRVPHPLVNGLLGAIFGGETPLGHLVRFPWGTSLLAVLQKPLPDPSTARTSTTGPDQSPAR